MDRCNQGSKRQRSRAAALGSAVEKWNTDPETLLLFVFDNWDKPECINNISNKRNGHGLACARACRSRVRTRMLVSRVHAYFFSRRSTKTYGHCPGSFLRLGACRCNKSGSSVHALGLPMHALAFPSCSAPHSIACASFSLCIVLSLWCPPRSKRTSSLWLCSAQWGSLSAWLCSVVLRLVPCFAYWAARILRNGPPQLYFWVLTGFNLPKWTFQVVLRLACLLLFLSVCHTKR